MLSKNFLFYIFVFDVLPTLWLNASPVADPKSQGNYITYIGPSNAQPASSIPSDPVGVQVIKIENKHTKDDQTEGSNERKRRKAVLVEVIDDQTFIYIYDPAYLKPDIYSPWKFYRFDQNLDSMAVGSDTSIPSNQQQDRHQTGSQSSMPFLEPARIENSRQNIPVQHVLQSSQLPPIIVSAKAMTEPVPGTIQGPSGEPEIFHEQTDAGRQSVYCLSCDQALFQHQYVQATSDSNGQINSEERRRRGDQHYTYSAASFPRQISRFPEQKARLHEEKPRLTDHRPRFPDQRPRMPAANVRPATSKIRYSNQQYQRAGREFLDEDNNNIKLKTINGTDSTSL